MSRKVKQNITYSLTISSKIQNILIYMLNTVIVYVLTVTSLYSTKICNTVLTCRLTVYLRKWQGAQYCLDLSHFPIFHKDK